MGSFGVSQAHIARLQERVSTQVIEQEVILDSVREGVVILAKTSTQNTEVDDKEQELLFYN